MLAGAIERAWDSWKVVRLIGRGGFGSVYEVVKERRLGEEASMRAAVKVIEIPNDETEFAQMRLEYGMTDREVTEYYRKSLKDIQSEIRILGQLNSSPHVVSIQDFAVVPKPSAFGWHILIRMELLKPLMDFRKEFGLSVGITTKMGVDIAKALETCATLNILHRDIKPGNVFITRFGDFKLGDFGISRHSQVGAHLFSTKGTKNFMAPEVYTEQAYDARADQYSLALTLYVLFNQGRLPFMPMPPDLPTAETMTRALARRISGEAIPKPSQADDAFAAILMKALSFSADDRYPDASSFREALETYRDSLSPDQLAKQLLEPTLQNNEVSSWPDQSDPSLEEPQAALDVSKSNGLPDSTTVNAYHGTPRKVQRYPEARSAAMTDAKYRHRDLPRSAQELASSRRSAPSQRPASSRRRSGASQRPAYAESGINKRASGRVQVSPDNTFPEPIRPSNDEPPKKKRRFLLPVFLLLFAFVLAAGGYYYVHVLKKEPEEIDYSGRIPDLTGHRFSIVRGSELEITLADGNVINGSYVGDVVNGRPHGEGAFTVEAGEAERWTYVGGWEDGLFSGRGIQVYNMATDEACWYDGHFQEGEYVGEGTYYLRSLQSGGSILTREWSGNIIRFILPLIDMDGHYTARLEGPSGDVVEETFVGTIRNGNYHTGDYRMVDADKRMITSRFENGREQGLFSTGDSLNALPDLSNHVFVPVEGDSITIYLASGQQVNGSYIGDLRAGQPDGRGAFTSDGSTGARWTYVGSWKDGLFSGKGIRVVECAAESAEWYDGQYADGVEIGQGVYYLQGFSHSKPYSEHYVGTFSQLQPNINFEGTFTQKGYSADGNRYDLQFVGTINNGLPYDGIRTEKWSSGDEYKVVFTRGIDEVVR